MAGLEKMAEFFEARIDGYDEHMMTNIESADEFYLYTARALQLDEGDCLLDLGCGTGLELEFCFKLVRDLTVTGIDLSEKMLNCLKNKLPDKNISLIQGSYFELPLGDSMYDKAVSVESLHHFTKEEKIPLYKRLRASLKNDGYFILTDYFAKNDDEEQSLRQNLLTLKAENEIFDNDLYHYDTPLTVLHETEALLEAEFSRVEILNNWGATYTLKAYK